MNARRRRLAKARRAARKRYLQREAQIRQLELKGYQVIRRTA